MAWSTDTFLRLYNWVTDKNNLIKIRADRMDAEFDNFKGGLEALLLRSGANHPTADIDWASFKLTGLGRGTAATDAATLDQVQSASAGANLFRNPGFTVAQRGTTFAVNNGAITLDGWRFWTDGNATATVGQQTSVNIATPSPGSPLESSLFITGTAVGTSTRMGIEQRLEGPKSFTQQSFGLLVHTNQNSGENPTLAGVWGINYGTGGSPSADVTGAITFDTYVPAAGGNKVTGSFTTGDLIGSKTFGTNGDAYFYVRLYTKSAVLTNSADLFTRWFAGVVLAASDGFYKPARFVARPPAVEMEICQRYFETSFPPGTAPAEGVDSEIYYSGTVLSANTLRTFVPFLVRKAKAAAITIYKVSSVSVNGRIGFYSGGVVVTSGSTSSFPGYRGFNADCTGTMTAGNTHLSLFQWTADAEL